MPNATSHSSHIVQIKSADGAFSFHTIKSPYGAKTHRHREGQIAADDLLTWVSATKSDGAARINAILELIVELGNVSRAKGEKQERTFSWQGRVFRAKANLRKSQTDREAEIKSKLNHRLRRYKLSPWYWVTVGDYPILGWWSGTDRPRDEEDPEEDVWFTEEDAIITILDLAREGQLCKIRRCYCGDWFFANFTHQKFCHLGCQQGYYRSSEEYKAKRRAYMKELRELHKKTYLVSPRTRAKTRHSSPEKVDGTSPRTKKYSSIHAERRNNKRNAK